MTDSTITCNSCGLIQRLEPLPPGRYAECARCGMTIAKARRNSLNRTAAFSLAALVLYVPANIYPILEMDFRGFYSKSTVWDGCVKLFEDGQLVVAVIVFMASILVPLCKLLGLFFLVVTTKLGMRPGQRLRTRVHRFIEVIGPWAMLDVFLLAILVSLLRLGSIATVTAGPGLVAFVSVVVFTLLASASFEPRLIWEANNRQS